MAAVPARRVVPAFSRSLSQQSRTKTGQKYIYGDHNPKCRGRRRRRRRCRCRAASFGLRAVRVRCRGCKETEGSFAGYFFASLQRGAARLCSFH